MFYPQGAKGLSVEAANLAGAVVHSQYLGVAVAVAVVGHLPSEEALLLRITGKRH